MRILVIGATGFIGGHAAAALVAAGHEVTALQRRGGTQPPGLPTVPGDLTDPASLTAAATAFDRVVHAGGPIDDATDSAAVTALLTAGSPLLLTTGAAVLGPGSSDEASEPRPHRIAAALPALERRVLAAGGWVLRPGMVYGNGGGDVPRLLADLAARRGTGVYIGAPGARWPVVHVDDLAELYVAVVERAAPGTVWHGMAETARLDAIAAALGGGSATSWPPAEATAELGLLADLFTQSQDVSAAATRAALGWTPAHTDVVAELGRNLGR